MNLLLDYQAKVTLWIGGVDLATNLG